MKQADISLAQIKSLMGPIPFCSLLGMELTAIDWAAQTLTIRVPFRDDLGRIAGVRQFHGGVISALIDTAGSVLVSAQIGGGSPTIDLRCDYLRPAGGDYIEATASIVRLGGKIASVDIVVHDSKDRVVATGRGAFGADG